MSLPFAEVSFPAKGMGLRIERLEVIREAFHHEVAVVRISNAQYSSVQFRSGEPVIIAWGNFPRVREEFYGYVHHSSPDYDEDLMRPAANLVCIGMTGPATNPRSKSWANTRSDLLVKEVAESLRMHHQLEKSERVLSSVVQGGVSSWKFIAEKAKKDGLVLYPRGPRVYLRNRDKVMRDFGDHAVTLRRGTATKLRGVVGELSPGEREAVRREGYGIGKNGLVAYSTDTRSDDLRAENRPRPLVDRIVTGFGATQTKDIEHVIEAEEREGAYIHEAEVDAPMLPHLGVCGPLVLDGFGKRYDGFWSVSRVKFVIAPGEKRSEIRMVKSTVTDPLVRPRLAGTRPRATYPDKLDDVARLVDGRWVAEDNI